MTVAPPLSIPGFADPFSSLSHIVGALVFAALTPPLVGKTARAHGGASRGARAALLIFACAAVALLAMSACYHIPVRGGPVRAVFQRLDHAAIFVLIAGTFTPIHTILFRGAWRWGMLGFIWLLAIAGVTLKSIYFHGTPESLGLALYIGMGWMGLVSIALLARRRGLRLVLPLLWGGLTYTAGALMDWLRWPELLPGVMGGHELFHVAVLAGLAFHWKFVWSIADASPAVILPGPSG